MNRHSLPLPENRPAYTQVPPAFRRNSRQPSAAWQRCELSNPRFDHVHVAHRESDFVTHTSKHHAGDEVPRWAFIPAATSRFTDELALTSPEVGGAALTAAGARTLPPMTSALSTAANRLVSLICPPPYEERNVRSRMYSHGAPSCHETTLTYGPPPSSDQQSEGIKGSASAALTARRCCTWSQELPGRG